MKTLYINTATRKTTIALFDGNQVVAEQRWPAEHNESEKLQPAVQQLLTKQKLAPDDIGQLMVCVGPGGFTSVRVGVSAMNTWAFVNKIPVAQVSVFDLYPTNESVIIVSANSNEAWVKLPGKDPQWVHQEQLQLPPKFSYGGILNADWERILDKLGGRFLELHEALPDVGALSFREQIVKPWYYKDANITWSAKHKPPASSQL